MRRAKRGKKGRLANGFLNSFNFKKTLTLSFKGLFTWRWGGGGGDPRLARYPAAGHPTYHVNVIKLK